MHFRFKTYLQSPIGIWNRLLRDVPYLLRGTTYYASCRNNDRQPQLPKPNYEVQKEYLDRKQHRDADAVVYTCITGGYDDITKIACPTAVDFDVDYVCFTDNIQDVGAGRIGVWSVRPLVFDLLDDTRNNRWHKTHPHLLFPEYGESVYIDANVNILGAGFIDGLRHSSQKMAFPRHPMRDCIFDEYANAFAEFIDSSSEMWKEQRAIRQSGMPRHYGLTENNIIYRKHNDPEVIAIMEEWWNMISRYSKRDQLSLPWILWKHGISMSAVSFSHWHDAPNTYCVFPHERRSASFTGKTSPLV